jgi:hypothetical protein
MPKRITKNKREFWKRLTRIEQDNNEIKWPFIPSIKYTVLCDWTTVHPDYWRQVDTAADEIKNAIDAKILKELNGL